MPVNHYIDTISIPDLQILKADRPRYRAIAAALATAIRSGQLPPGTKLPPHRVLADAIGVTVGTVSRAYTELEHQGLTKARIGAGTFVSDQNDIQQGFFRAVTTTAANTIDLGLNTHLPSHEASLLAQTLAELATDQPQLTALLQYQPDVGMPSHREAGAQWLSRSGIECEPEQVVVTNGAQHALLCSLMAVARCGETVGAEGLTYPGLATAARHLGLRLRGLPLDEQGLIPEGLAEACKRSELRILFCTPTLHNPTTAIMSLARRQAIAELARQYNLVLIEDDVYGPLAGDRPPPLYSLAPERTILIGSVTKALASGLRIGYLLAPAALRVKIALALRGSCWMATPLAAEIAARWIDNGAADRLIAQQREQIQHRKALVADLLAPLRPQTHPCSAHFWIELPTPWRASELVAELTREGVLIKAAETFGIGHYDTPQAIRVSVAGHADDAALVASFQKIRDLLVLDFSAN